MTENNLLILKESPLFTNMTMEDIDKMVSCLSPLITKYQKNDFVKLQGDIMDSFGLVLLGAVTVSQENEAGSRTIIASIGPGDLFGEMLVFSDKKKWPVIVQAQTESEVMFIRKDRLISQCAMSCNWHRMLIQNMLSILSRKALYLNKRVKYMSIKSISGKLAKYFLEQYQLQGKKDIFSIPLNRNELADFLNVSRPSMSREMSRLREDQVIDFHMSTIRIKDIEALKLLMTC